MVIGCGRVGSAVARELAEDGWDVTAVDEKELPKYLKDSKTLPFITVKAIVSISLSLERLAQPGGLLPLASECPSLSLARRLLSICDRREVQDGAAALSRFLEVAKRKADEMKEELDDVSDTKDETEVKIFSVPVPNPFRVVQRSMTLWQ